MTGTVLKEVFKEVSDIAEGILALCSKELPALHQLDAMVDPKSLKALVRNAFTQSGHWRSLDTKKRGNVQAMTALEPKLAELLCHLHDVVGKSEQIRNFMKDAVVWQDRVAAGSCSKSSC